MIRKTIVYAFLLACARPVHGQPTAPNSLKRINLNTEWTRAATSGPVLPEYPRPQLVRTNWINLNGPWDYALTGLEAQAGDMPAQLSADRTGKIIVPFAIESALSGVRKLPGKDSLLWYRKKVSLVRKPGQRLLLHFGAVDWRCEVWVNGRKAGLHEGGYTAFNFDITSLLKEKGEQELLVKVWDPTSYGHQPHGKQTSWPSGHSYTSVTGIWQTVWMEWVPESYISGLRQLADPDRKCILFLPAVEHAKPSDRVRYTVYEQGKKIAGQDCRPEDTCRVILPDFRWWDTEHPFLYDVKVELIRDRQTVDTVRSYFAMRKVSLGKDASGITRIMLNNRFVFNIGPLDQGFWPDGLYTAPTDAALASDIERTKAMGFNTIRKHLKAEPERWYYHADRLGILVWQDMTGGEFGREKGDGEADSLYKREWGMMIDQLYNHPSIIMWVPFNQVQARAGTAAIADWTKRKDPSRLTNGISGYGISKDAPAPWQQAGDVLDIHMYPGPALPRLKEYNGLQAMACGEYGRYREYSISGHSWENLNTGEKPAAEQQQELLECYKAGVDSLMKLIPLGLSGAIYTQITDVESEENGIMTYDRLFYKIPVDILSRLNRSLWN